MGSLMAGWSSPVRDPKSVRRNKSLTKEEIEAFRKMKKKIEAEHLEAISKLVNDPEEERERDETPETMIQRSQSLPDASKKAERMGSVTETSSDNPTKKHGWWRRTNWAFLNEPAAAEGRPNSYVAQVHVANTAQSHK